MGETLQADEASKMEKQLKDGVQKSKLQNGEGEPILDAGTHRKLMRLFSQNANINLCLPIVKLHRLEAQDLKRCQGLSEECSVSLRVQIRRLNRNARRRAKRKFTKTSASCNAPSKYHHSKSTLPSHKNLTNGVNSNEKSKGDDAMAGPSKKVNEEKCTDDSSSENIPYKKLKSDVKKKKNHGKELFSGSGFDNRSGDTSNSKSAKVSRWEEQYLPTLAGPRAPLPPAPLLNLDAPRSAHNQVRPMGVSRLFPSPFERSLQSAAPPPLKPIIHAANVPKVQKILIPNPPVPPPLHVGNVNVRPGIDHHPFSLVKTLSTVQQELMPNPVPVIQYQEGVLDTGIKSSHPVVLPAAPNLVLKPENSRMKSQMGPYSASITPQSKVMSAPLPFTQQHGKFPPQLGKEPPLLAQSQTKTFANTSDGISKVEKHTFPRVDAGSVKGAVTSSPVKNSSSLPCVPLSVLSQPSPVSTVSKPSPKKSLISEMPVISYPSTSSEVVKTTSVLSDFSACSTKLCDASMSRSVTSHHHSVESVSDVLSVTSTSPNTLSRIVSVVNSVPSVSSMEGVTTKTSNSKMPLVLLPISTVPSADSPGVSVAQSSPTTSVSLLYVLLTPSATPRSTNSPKNAIIDNVQAINAQSKDVGVHERTALSSSQVSSPSLSKPSMFTECSSVPSPKSKDFSNQNQKHCNGTGLAVPREHINDSSPYYLTSSSTDTVTTSSTSLPVMTVASLPKPPQKARLGFKTMDELEEFIINWIEDNYEMCKGFDIEQYKVQGHFQYHLRAKARKYRQHPPILSCLKKVFGDEITTRRYRVDGHQRWHYCHIRPRQDVTLPAIKTPKTRIRRRKIQDKEMPGSKSLCKDDDAIRVSKHVPQCDGKTVKVTKSLAVLSHLINTTKQYKGTITHGTIGEDTAALKLEISSSGLATSSSELVVAVPSSCSDPVAATAGGSNSKSCVAAMQSSPKNSAHLTQWIQSKISTGKIVRVATLVVCLKKLRHFEMTNVFMKKNHINMRSGLRIRQMLRTWDIRNFLKAGGKKGLPSPLIRSKRLPKVGPLGSKSAAVQEMLMQARIGIEDELPIDCSIPSGTVVSSSNMHHKLGSGSALPPKKQLEDEILPNVEFERITPILNKRDKYLLMRNERLTSGQKKFACWLGFDLAKKALKNRRLDRVEGSRRRLDLSFFGLKSGCELSSWSMRDDVQGGKKGTTVVCKTSAGTKPMKKVKALKTILPPVIPGQTASSSLLPHGYTYASNSGVIPLTSQHQVITTLTFPKINPPPAYVSKSVILTQVPCVQTTAAAAMGTVVCSASQGSSSQDFSRVVSANAQDSAAAGPSSRSSPPPRLTFMGGNTGYMPSNVSTGFRIQRPMPPPLSFMGSSAESQGRQPSHHGPSQTSVGRWSGNVDYPYPQAPGMRNYGVINHTRQILSNQQHPSQKPHNIASYVVLHRHQYANSSVVAQGTTLLEKQLSHARNVPGGHLSNQRPSSLPQSVQSKVVLEQRPSSEPQNTVVSGTEGIPTTLVTQTQLHEKPLRFVSGQYSANQRPLYSFSQQQSGQSHTMSTQQLYTQSHHVQDHSFSHQQQSNLPHNLPGHVVPSHQLSNQSYARGYVYPNQQGHSLQSRAVLSQQLGGNPQDGQMYVVPRQQQQTLNQAHNIQGYTPSQTLSNQNSNPQLSSSYSIQNLMLPVHQHYRGPNLSHEYTSSILQTSNSNHAQQNSPKENIAYTGQNVQREVGDNQEVWNKQVKAGQETISTPIPGRPQGDIVNDTYIKSPSSTESNEGNRLASLDRELCTETSDDQYSKVQNTNECNSPRVGKSVITHAFPWNESEVQTKGPVNVNEKLFSIKSGNVSMDSHSISRPNEMVNDVEGENPDQQVCRKLDSFNISSEQASNKLQGSHGLSDVQAPSRLQATQELSNNNVGGESQSIIKDAAMPQMSLDFTEKVQNNDLNTRAYPNGTYLDDDVQSSLMSKLCKGSASDKDIIFMNTQEQLPCDLDHINVSRFGLEENLNLSSFLQDTDKRSYQRDGLFDKLDNQQMDSTSALNWQPVNQETSSDSNQLDPSTSGINNAQDSNVTHLKNNVSEHLSKLESLILRLLEIGLPESYESMRDTALQLLEIEGISSSSCQDADFRKWYEEFSASVHMQVFRKTKKQQLQIPAENEVALWINKVKGEMLMFSDVSSSRIFYMQELNFFLDKQTRQIKFHKMFSDNKTCSNEKDTVSVLFTFNASGQIGPGMIIFPRMVIPEKLFASLKITEGGKEWVIGSSSNGWLYTDCISEFVSDVFIPWLEVHQLQQPVALFTSEYISNIPLTEMCQNFVPQGVHLILVPRAMAPVVSPAEKIVAQYFVTSFGRTVRDWSVASDSQTLTEDNFAPFIISSVRNKIINGDVNKIFRDLGIWPFDGRLVFEQFQRNKL